MKVVIHMRIPWMLHERMVHGRIVSMLPGVNHIGVHMLQGLNHRRKVHVLPGMSHYGLLFVPPRMTHSGMVSVMMRNMVPGRMGLVKYVIARSNLNIRLLECLLGRIGTLQADRLNVSLMACHGWFSS
ncbi:hypothetical protein PDENDC454_07945 [Paenibacillus dendritiformis C454]|uniref:Uncharacterized protein n=1 Tax=Paenibacillus dendritiformis C454 TaxID=1131935 RepID=H3SDM8_9BACL|nr:hypothetical protein PDENDC454_07945 [Paenibacillus dendritiformis C454]